MNVIQWNETINSQRSKTGTGAFGPLFWLLSRPGDIPYLRNDMMNDRCRVFRSNGTPLSSPPCGTIDCIVGNRTGNCIHSLIRTLLFAVIVAAVGCATVVAAPGLIIDAVEIKKDVDKATTILRLRSPFRYLGHFPESEGRVLKVRIQPLLRNAFVPGIEESVSPSIDDCPVIRDIALERGVGDDYTLTYHFREAVRYQVATRTDPQQIVVILLNPHSDEAGDPCHAGQQ